MSSHTAPQPILNVQLEWKMQAEAYDKCLKTNMMIDGQPTIMFFFY